MLAADKCALLNRNTALLKKANAHHADANAVHRQAGGDLREGHTRPQGAPTQKARAHCVDLVRLPVQSISVGAVGVGLSGTAVFLSRRELLSAAKPTQARAGRPTSPWSSSARSRATRWPARAGRAAERAHRWPARAGRAARRRPPRRPAAPAALLRSNAADPGRPRWRTRAGARARR